MRTTIIGAVALAIAVFGATAAFAGEKVHVKHSATYNYAASGDYSRPQNFTIIRTNGLTKGGSAFIKMHLKPSEAQALINSDRALAAELRARGVQIKNVLGAERAFNGRLVVYTN